MARKKYTVKMSKNAKPFLARSAHSNRAQMAFKANIGDKIGPCISRKEKDRSFTLGEKVEHIKECQLEFGVSKGMKFPVIDPNSYYNRKREGRIGGGQPVPRATVATP